MGQSIQGAGQSAPLQRASSDQQLVKELTKQLGEAAKEASSALQDLSDELAGKVSVRNPNKAGKKSGLEGDTQVRESGMEELAGEIAASVAGQDEVDRKKQKRKKLEAKLKTMGGILEQIDASALEEDDQKEIEFFQKNLKQMNQLNRRLSQLEQEEDHLNSLLNQRSR